MRAPTASAGTRRLGLAAVVAVGLTAVLGLWGTPTSAEQGELYRLVYVHPAMAVVSYLAFAVTAVASLLYLVPRTRTRLWDLTAGASAEVGVVFCALTLVTGSIWGRPTWGVWWTWDARLTTTALLLALFLGYLALRRVPAPAGVRARRSAVAGLVAAADIPVVHMSVTWWRTLHQDGTVLRPDLQPQMDPEMLRVMLLSFAAFTLVYVWLVIHRFRVEVLQERLDRESLATALEERRAEAALAETGAS